MQQLSLVRICLLWHECLACQRKCWTNKIWNLKRNLAKDSAFARSSTTWSFGSGSLGVVSLSPRLLVSLSPSLSWLIYPTVGVNAWQECIWMCVRPLHACCCPMLCFASFWPGGKFIKMVLLWTSRSTGATAADGIETGKQTRYSKTTCSNWRQSAKDSQRQKYWKTLRKPWKTQQGPQSLETCQVHCELSIYQVPNANTIWTQQRKHMDSLGPSIGNNIYTWRPRRVIECLCRMGSLTLLLYFSSMVLTCTILHRVLFYLRRMPDCLVRTLGSGYTAQLPLTIYMKDHEGCFGLCSYYEHYELILPLPTCSDQNNHLDYPEKALSRYQATALTWLRPCEC